MTDTRHTLRIIVPASARGLAELRGRSGFAPLVPFLRTDGRPFHDRCPPIRLRSASFDYSKTLFLPQTDFPMRGGLPQKEPEILAPLAARWTSTSRLRESVRRPAEIRAA